MLALRVKGEEREVFAGETWEVGGVSEKQTGRHLECGWLSPSSLKMVNKRMSWWGLCLCCETWLMMMLMMMTMMVDDDADDVAGGWCWCWPMQLLRLRETGCCCICKTWIHTFVSLSPSSSDLDDRHHNQSHHQHPDLANNLGPHLGSSTSLPLIVSLKMILPTMCRS